MPSQSFAHSATTGADPATVWASLDRPETWEAIPGVDRVVNPLIDGEGHLRGFDFETTVGGRSYPGKASPNARLERRLMAWNISSPQIEGVIHVALEGEAEGTRIDVRVDMASVGMLSSMFFPVIARTVEEGLPRTVEKLTATLG